MNNNPRLVQIIIISSILIIIIIFNAGCFGTPEEDSGNGTSALSATKKDTTYSYEITIAAVSGGTFAIEETTFAVTASDGTKIGAVKTPDANPPMFNREESMIYPIPTGGGPVIDRETNAPVTDTTEFSNYENCFLTVVDSNSDNLLSIGDMIIIFKDNNADNTDDITEGCTIKIVDENDRVVLKKTL
ncbi:hypothetical protein [[Eubacterium] cellulosolvens]